MMPDNLGDISAKTARRAFLLDALSFFLLLLFPYLNFIARNDFVFESSNLIVGVGFAFLAGGLALFLKLAPFPGLRLLMLTGLILVFADFQFIGGFLVVAVTGSAFLIMLCLPSAHRSLVVTAVFGTMVVATLVSLPFADAGPVTTSASTSSPAENAAKSDLPVYVHIILDGQLGVEGFQDDAPAQKAIKTEIQELFSGNGFRVFSRAYSLYDRTQQSLSSAFNSEKNGKLEGLFSENEYLTSYRLNRNLYFDKLGARGYRINVYQSMFLDFCGSSKRNTGTCVSYDQGKISSVNLKGFSDSEKLEFVLSVYSDLLFLKKKLKALYKPVRKHLGRIGFDLPAWGVHHLYRIWPLTVLPAFERLIADVASAPRGDMFFAHFLLPHEPFAVDSSCGIRRPVLQWPTRVSSQWDGDPVLFNTPGSRLAGYEAYIPQVRCALSKIEKLLNVMKERKALKDAIVIVHGDHGSRLMLVDPTSENKNRLSKQDYFDAFSTLYAIKSPGIDSGIDRRMMSLDDLLGGALEGTGPESAFAANSPHFIYLRMENFDPYGHWLCRVIPISWMRRSDDFLPETLRRWKEGACRGRSASIYAKVEKVDMPEIPGGNR